MDIYSSLVLCPSSVLGREFIRQVVSRPQWDPVYVNSSDSPDAEMMAEVDRNQKLLLLSAKSRAIVESLVKNGQVDAVFDFCSPDFERDRLHPEYTKHIRESSELAENLQTKLYVKLGDNQANVSSPFKRFREFGQAEEVLRKAGIGSIHVYKVGSVRDHGDNWVKKIMGTLSLEGKIGKTELIQRILSNSEHTLAKKANSGYMAIPHDEIYNIPLTG